MCYSWVQAVLDYFVGFPAEELRDPIVQVAYVRIGWRLGYPGLLPCIISWCFFLCRVYRGILVGVVYYYVSYLDAGLRFLSLAFYWLLWLEKLVSVIVCIVGGLLWRDMWFDFYTWF